MKKPNYLQQRSWFTQKINIFKNGIPTFLKIVILINVSLLLALLVINLVFYFTQKNQETTSSLFLIPNWLIFIATFFGSIFNLISIVLMFYKKKTTFIWGILAAICFGLPYFKNELWGSVIIYWGYFTISQIVMFFWWSKKINNDKKIITRHTKLWEFFLMCALLVATSVGFLFIRWKVPGIQTWFGKDKADDIFEFFKLFFDSFIISFTFSIVYFVAKRYIERWIISLIVNGAQIILCSLLIATSIKENNWIDMTNNIILLLSTITLFAISWYSWINWNKDNDK